jgi:hypothetical protein
MFRSTACGDEDGNIIAGMLVEEPHATKMDRSPRVAGQAIIEVGEEVWTKTCNIECKFSPIGVDGRHALMWRPDTRWDKRQLETLTCLAAPSPRTAFFLPIRIEAMSTVCINARKGRPHKEVPVLYEGSSKGMEATGAENCETFV